MAKAKRVRYTRSARSELSSLQTSRTHRPNTAPILAQDFRHTVMTPTEFFMHSLQADEEVTDLDGSVLGPGADIKVVLRLHFEELRNATTERSPIHTLIVRVETPLPTGGTHTMRLDHWEKNELVSLLLKEMSPTTKHPLEFAHTLGWLYAVVSAIEARPARRVGDVWWRFLGFVKDVKEAYRFAPRSENPGDCSAAVHSRPRPRPRRTRTDLSNLTDALTMLHLADEDVARPDVQKRTLNMPMANT